MAPRRNVAPPRDLGEAVAQLAERVGAIEGALGSVLPGSGEWEFIESGGVLRVFNRRTALVQDLPVICTSATRPTGDALRRGLHIWETDTGRALVYHGATSGWLPGDWDSPWGSYDRVFQSTPALSNTGTESTMFSRSITVPVANRITRFTLAGSIFPTTGTESAVFRLKINGGQVKLWQMNCTVAGAYHTLGNCEATLVLSPATYTVDITWQRTGTGTQINADNSTACPEFIVDDAGPLPGSVAPAD